MTAAADHKIGPALANQRFQMLEDIAKELAGDVTFPVCFDVAVQLRKVLADPNQSLQSICKVISGEPLVCSRLLGLANMVAYNGGGPEVRDIKSAVQRLGLNVVRTAAMAVVMKQMLQAKEMLQFQDIATKLWDHSIVTAAAAGVVARQMTRLSPDDALLAGLIHDLGAFYMLYRATRYEELRLRPDTVRYLIMQWHESIGDTLLNALGVPEKITAAIRDHDQPRPVPRAPVTLADIVYVANVIAGGAYEAMLQDLDAAQMERNALGENYLALLPEIEAQVKEMRAAFR